jgi:hypothetical protein
LQSYFIARNRKPRSAEVVDLHGALEREEGMEGERERERDAWKQMDCNLWT